MSSTPSLDPALRDELHRRIGRNLLTFQKIERAWKRLLLTSVADTAFADGLAALEARAASVLRMNMGQLWEGLFDDVFTQSPKERRPKGDLSKGWIRTRFSFEPHPEHAGGHEALQERWRALIDERNQLVHHFFDRWREIDQLQLALDELDRQNHLAESVLSEVTPLVQQLEQVRKQVAAHFDSPEGHRDLLTGVAMARVIELLWTTAETKARSDGWTYETTALSLLHENAPEDVRLLREANGPGWLRDLLEEPNGAFETMTEALPNANGPAQTRMLYRQRAS